MTIFIRRALTQQPQYAPRAIVRSPRTILHLLRSGQRASDLVSGSIPTPTGTPTIAPQFGLVTSSGNYLTGGKRPSFNGLDAITLITRVQVNPTEPAYQAIVGTASSSTFINLRVNPWSGTQVNIEADIYIAGALRTSNLATLNHVPANGDKYTIGMRFAKPDLQVFVRRDTGDRPGPFSFSSAIAYGASIDDTGGNGLLFGRNTAGTQSLAGSLEYVLIEDRWWTDSELATLGTFPSRFVAPLPRRIWVPTTAAATAPTLSALSAINVTASSAQPRITYTF